jgi:putative nucleotidyltransferase with HDIG domain
VLEAGASDYLAKPIAPDALLRAVSKHTELAPAERFDVAREILKVALRTASGASASDLTIEDRLQPIFNTLGFKRFETLQHSRRVAAYSLLIARDLGLDGRALRALAVGALLHDVGKAGIPHNVLFKPGILNDQEREIVKMHPQLGRELLAGLPDLNPEAQLVYSHHERFDGTGYPRQLAGDEIPLSARIFAVADTLDAITSDRCYRKGESVSAARAEIHRGAGSQFDPLVAELLDRITDEELETVRRQFPDAF